MEREVTLSFIYATVLYNEASCGHALYKFQGSTWFRQKSHLRQQRCGSFEEETDTEWTEVYRRLFAQDVIRKQRENKSV